MIHIFTWGLLITALVLGAWLDKRLDAKEHQFIGRHIVTVIVIVGLYPGPMIAPKLKGFLDNGPKGQFT